MQYQGENMEAEQNSNGECISQEKLEANRRNAQRSTGPKTEQGKNQSRLNALKHGVLSSSVVVTKGEGAEDPAEFDELLGNLRQDLAPAGALEEMLVEKIAVCWWRQKRALRCEAGLIRRAFVPDSSAELDEMFSSMGHGPSPKLASIKDHHSLPLGVDLDRILRYETTIYRQMGCAITQLERLQRARRGEHVPAPVSIQLSGDQ
jgi:hypothetical protein